MAEGQTEFDFVKPKHDSESRLKPSAREQQTVFEAKSSIFFIFFFAHVQVRVIHDDNFQTGF